MERGENPELLEVTADWAICLKPAGTESEKGMPLLLEKRLEGRFFPVHRLDLNVGGVMVYARSREAAAELSRLIQEGAFRKEYAALVHGAPSPEGRMEDLLWKDSVKNKVFVVKRPRQGVRKAVLTYRILGSAGEDRTAAAVFLETGRSHQIRVQFASRGFPLWGDHKYGARDGDRVLRLFCRRIAFPWRGREIAGEALPDWMPQGLYEKNPPPEVFLRGETPG